MEEKRELNLWELCLICFRAIRQFFAGAYYFSLSTFRLSLRFWYIVVPFVLLGIGGGLYFSRSGNRIYHVGTMVRLNGVNHTDVNRIYESLCLATPEFINQQQSLSTLLALPAEQTSKLRKFQTWGVIDYQRDSIPDIIDKRNKHDLADTVTIIMPDYLYLTFQTKAPQEVQVVGQAIINYLNNNATLQEEYTAYKNVIQRKADFCCTQIDKLDSLTTAFYFEQAGVGQVQYNRWSSALVVGDRSIELLHPDILHLIKTNEFVQKQLVMASAPVVPLGDFLVEPHAVNSRLKCLGLGLLVGYVLGCILAFAWKRRKQFPQWLAEE